MTPTQAEIIFSLTFMLLSIVGGLIVWAVIDQRGKGGKS